MIITPNDLATIFSLEWYRDFPLDGKHRESGSRSDWTQHIAISFRNSISAFGFFTWFETKGRYDAVAEDNNKVRVLAEWEWQSPADASISEIEKLRKGSKTENPDLCFLLTYAPTTNSIEKIVGDIANLWDTSTPLLLGLITYDGRSYRIFKQLKMFEVTSVDSWRQLREQPALPWEVAGSRWVPPPVA